MRRTVSGLLGACALCCATCAAAPAALADGFYVNLHGGPRYLLDADQSRDPHGEPLDVGRLHFDNIGGTVGLAGGYDWDNGLGLETEFAYRRNGLDHDVFHGDSTDLDGSLSSYTLLANVYYRLNTGTAVTPYIGGGVGISLLDLDMKRGEEERFHALDTDTQFAYQGIAGLDYAIAPHWSVGAEYRFFGTTDPSFIDHPDGNRVWTETVYHAHELLFGVTYRFD
jgi:opacity protein-like surface antigen